MGGLDIYISQRPTSDAPWGAPENVAAVNSIANELCPTLTLDGEVLFFVSDREGGCGGQDMYLTRRRGRQPWELPANLGCAVNSPLNDFTPSYVVDRSMQPGSLYFSSNRPGGAGGADIYVSAQLWDGTFAAATPVYELNTFDNDQRPNVRHDGLEIFFDSDRPGSLGSGDLWVSTRQGTFDPWSAPSNLGPVVNTGAMEGRPSVSFTGRTLYFMSNRPGSTPGPTGAASVDIYMTTRKWLRPEG